MISLINSGTSTNYYISVYNDSLKHYDYTLKRNHILILQQTGYSFRLFIPNKNSVAFLFHPVPVNWKSVTPLKQPQIDACVIRWCHAAKKLLRDAFFRLLPVRPSVRRASKITFTEQTIFVNHVNGRSFCEHQSSANNADLRGPSLVKKQFLFAHFPLIDEVVHYNDLCN